MSQSLLHRLQEHEEQLVMDTNNAELEEAQTAVYHAVDRFQSALHLLPGEMLLDIQHMLDSLMIEWVFLNYIEHPVKKARLAEIWVEAAKNFESKVYETVPKVLPSSLEQNYTLMTLAEAVDFCG